MICFCVQNCDDPQGKGENASNFWAAAASTVIGTVAVATTLHCYDGMSGEHVRYPSPLSVKESRFAK